MNFVSVCVCEYLVFVFVSVVIEEEAVSGDSAVETYASFL